MKPKRLVSFVLWPILLLAGCLGSPGPTVSPTVESSAIAVSINQTVTPKVTAPASATPTPSLPPPGVISKPGEQLQICSPLAEFSLVDLETAIFNPFDPPAAGLDGPHQGVDFADLEPINGYAREGLAVQAVLTGKVAAVIDNRFPYGHALLIETSLTDLPAIWLETLHLPAIQSNQTPHPALTCPDLALPDWDLQTRSLYLLYAHLQQRPQLTAGESVTCGQTLGAIGSSGNALNPHLHLELRVGPSEARFKSLAHYDPSASAEEMANYCAWRVRGIFQLIDPLLLLQQLP
jgi:murein DD-endopeptidase MepM/ murein hydrolase activator NlpD